MPRFGRIAIAGRPNAGKSSLLNAILGTHLSMVSPKAQATRLPVTGLVTDADSQLVFVDLPGLLEPEYLLQRSMRHLAIDALRTVDLVLFLWPAPDAPAPDFRSLVPDAPPFRAEVLTVYTKADLVTSAVRASLADSAPITSVTHRPSIDRLLGLIRTRVPPGEFQFPADDLATQPTRFFVTEYLREAAFEALEDELPYAFAAEIDEFREAPKPLYIRATIYVERESQKGIVIGQGGATLRRIGTHARERLEALLGEKVYLETWVKVLPRWRRNASALARFGFPIPQNEAS
ncbi:MAG TPA: GTPase Era [Gemmatimonadales bacterium]|jgi:GTP-binding protein Era